MINVPNCMLACQSFSTHSAQRLSRQVYSVAAMPAVALPCSSPAVLSLSEDGLVERVEFLEELGLSQEQLAKVTVAHPQVRLCLNTTAFKAMLPLGIA